MTIDAVTEASNQLARSLVDGAPPNWKRIRWRGANVARPSEPYVLEQIPEYATDHDAYQWFDTGFAPIRYFALLFDKYTELNFDSFTRADLMIERSKTDGGEITYHIEYSYDLGSFDDTARFETEGSD